jgi:membrane dipeptidase
MGDQAVRDENLAKARDIVATALVWDNHACMPLRPDDHSFLPQLKAIHDAGVDVISLNVGFGPQPPEKHLAMLDSFTAWLGEHPDDYMLIRTAADVDIARRSDRLGILFDVEGMFPLNNRRIDLVESFRRKGVGWMLVAYNRNNESGGGCADDDTGLTAYGRDVIAEMNRVGMIVCCSHTGHRTAMQVMEVADGPVIFSHSNALALWDHYRNIPDTLIKACAQTGGVIGINGLGTFLGHNDASAQRVAEHIDHVAQLVGTDHVGIGLDYVFDKKELEDFLLTMSDTFPDDDSFRQPINMFHPKFMGEIVASLLARGYNAEDLHKILGRNWLRVAEQVWSGS